MSKKRNQNKRREKRDVPFLSKQLGRQLSFIMWQLENNVQIIQRKSNNSTDRGYTVQSAKCDLISLKNRLRILLQRIPRGTILFLKDGTRVSVEKIEGFILTVTDGSNSKGVLITEVDL